MGARRGQGHNVPFRSISTAHQVLLLCCPLVICRVFFIEGLWTEAVSSLFDVPLGSSSAGPVHVVSEGADSEAVEVSTYIRRLECNGRDAGRGMGDGGWGMGRLLLTDSTVHQLRAPARKRPKPLGCRYLHILANKVPSVMQQVSRPCSQSYLPYLCPSACTPAATHLPHCSTGSRGRG